MRVNEVTGHDYSLTMSLLMLFDKMISAVLMVILATLVPTINCQVMYQHILAAKSDLLKVNNWVSLDANQ